MKWDMVREMMMMILDNFTIIYLRHILASSLFYSHLVSGFIAHIYPFTKKSGDAVLGCPEVLRSPSRLPFT